MKLRFSFYFYCCSLYFFYFFFLFCMRACIVECTQVYRNSWASSCEMVTTEQPTTLPFFRRFLCMLCLSKIYSTCSLKPLSLFFVLVPLCVHSHWRLAEAVRAISRRHARPARHHTKFPRDKFRSRRFAPASYRKTSRHPALMCLVHANHLQSQ